MAFLSYRAEKENIKKKEMLKKNQKKSVRKHFVDSDRRLCSRDASTVCGTLITCAPLLTTHTLRQL